MTGRRAYVVGGYEPNGGTKMHYRVGHVLRRRFGFDVVVVERDVEQRPRLLHYPEQYPVCSIDDMFTEAGPRDVVISGEAFGDPVVGLRTPAFKVMFVQSVTRIGVLDGFFDAYVAVSAYVRDFLRTCYRIEAPVIGACLEPEVLSRPAPAWDERPARSFVLYGKTYRHAIRDAMASRVRARDRADVLDGMQWISGAKLEHHAFLSEIAARRHFVPIAPVEGFGLTALEAMAMGCAVVGFHGWGGLEYMRDGSNCRALAYPDVEGLCDALLALLDDEASARRLAAAGRATALAHDIDSFESAWASFFDRSLPS